ncbi:hypothetical protein LCGC14_1290710 [marine sediment metagenome]|uniref:Uncharacterized protein n=1 Tax=marine sediment metagenome TaxID=412755 RepID=A0A0F9LDH2_9ZZZZ
MKKRKQFNMSKIDTVTLDYLYNVKLYRINEISLITGKTRQRIWQLLKEYGIHNNSRVTRECEYCHERFEVVRSRARRGSGKYCSDDHYHEHRRSLGYEPDKQGQRKGRQVIESWLGHPLPVKMIVHYEDGDQVNNDISNLWVFPSNAEHIRYHHAKRNGKGKLPYQELWQLPNMIEEWVKVL